MNPLELIRRSLTWLAMKITQRGIMWFLAGLLLTACVYGLVGCGGQRRTQAQLAANIYAAAEAAGQGADLAKTQTAIRLQAEKIANLNGYSIEGAPAWTASLQPSPPATGSPTPTKP